MTAHMVRTYTQSAYFTGALHCTLHCTVSVSQAKGQAWPLEPSKQMDGNILSFQIRAWDSGAQPCQNVESGGKMAA